MDVGLRRDTTDVETCASDVVALEDHDLQPLLGGIFSGAVTSRPRTDYYQIYIFRHNYSVFICLKVTTGCLAARTSSTRPIGVS